MPTDDSLTRSHSDPTTTRGVLSVFFPLVLALIIAAFTSIAIADGELHTGGQPDTEDLSAFAAGGGTQIIDLRGVNEDRGFDEAAAARQRGLHYHSLPITGAAGLNRDNVEALDRLLEQTVGQGEKTLLHCASGNRVGALMALRAHWLHGNTEAEALAIGRAHGMTGLEAQVRELLREK